MFGYYTSIIILTWLTLIILCILVHENDRIPVNDKQLLELTYVLIAASAMAEWFGVYLNGRAGLPSWVLLVIKCLDYILTPIAGGALVTQMQIRNRWNSILIGGIICNTIFQILSCFFGWMIQIDDQNHYTHGPMYPVYLVFCLLILLILTTQFIIYGRSFRRQNQVSLYAILFLVIVGEGMQEVLPGNIRTAYIALTLGAALLYIHNTEFSSLAMDDYLEEQKIRIDTDALTGVRSRHAYARTLEAYNAAGKIPERLAAFTIDINGLKQVNDSLGHEAGDELICGAARCIEIAVGMTVPCFRTGGDEFVILAEMDRKEAEDVSRRLTEETAAWKGRKVGELSVSIGYALAEDHPDLSAEKLVREADMAMYEAKAEYYRNAQKDRRRHQPKADLG